VSELEIGEATREERTWCGELMARSEPWTTLRRDRDACLLAALDRAYLTLVARKDGAPVGFARYHPRGVAGAPYLASVAVAEEARGTGVGSALLAAGEERFRSEGARWMFLCVSSFNALARALYERHGYRLVGELQDYVVDGFSELLMVKRLA
jgi:ribosomal protein S18 acetylase RimI-like enzyme